MKIYHHNDLDGRCVAAVVFTSAMLAIKTEFIECSYNKEINNKIYK